MSIRYLVLYLTFCFSLAGITQVFGVTEAAFPQVEEEILLDEERAEKLNKEIIDGLKGEEKERYDKLYKMTLDLYDRYPEDIIRPHNIFLMLLVTLLGNPGYLASDPLSGALGWGFSIPGNLLSLPSVKWNCVHCRQECPLEGTCSICDRKRSESLKKLLVTLGSSGSIVEAGRNGLCILFRTSEGSLLGGLANQGTLPLPSGKFVPIPLVAASFIISVFNFYLLYGLCEGAIDSAKDMVEAYRHPGDYSNTLTEDKLDIAGVMKQCEHTVDNDLLTQGGVFDCPKENTVAWVQYHARQILDITRRENIQKLADAFRELSSAKKGALVAAAVTLFASSQLWVLLEIASVEAVVLASILAPTASISTGYLIAPLMICSSILGWTHGLGMTFLALMGYGSLGQKVAECTSAFKGRFCDSDYSTKDAKSSSWLWKAGKFTLGTMILGSSLAAGWYTYNNLYPAYCLLHTIVASVTGAASNVFTPALDMTKLVASNASAVSVNMTHTLTELSGSPTAGYLAACIKAGTLTPLQKAWTVAATATYSGIVYAAIPCGPDIGKAVQSTWQRLKGAYSSNYRNKRARFKRQLEKDAKKSGPNDSGHIGSASKHRKIDNHEVIPMTPQNSRDVKAKSFYDNVETGG